MCIIACSLSGRFPEYLDVANCVDAGHRSTGLRSGMLPRIGIRPTRAGHLSAADPAAIQRLRPRSLSEAFEWA